MPSANFYGILWWGAIPFIHRFVEPLPDSLDDALRSRPVICLGGHREGVRLPILDDRTGNRLLDDLIERHRNERESERDYEVLSC
jgi:hypothetical protein